MEALLCFCFFAISLSISAAMGVGRLRDPLADIPVAALSLTILTMGVRFVYHISWLTYLRYRLAHSRPFSLGRTVITSAWTYGAAYILATGLGLFPLWDLIQERPFSIVLPSFLAAVLAPAVLYWLRGETFDSRVAADTAADAAAKRSDNS